MSEQQPTTPESPPTTPAIPPTETTPPTTTSSAATETPPTPPKEPSLLNKEEPKAPEAPKAPEKYADFKLPEGVKLDGELLTEATTLFKDLGLPQEGAQRLVDFHTKALAKAGQDPVDAWGIMVKEWGEKTAADPEIGPKIKEVKATIGKAYDTLITLAGDKGPAMRETVAEFKSVMDLTGAGNHPAFVKMLAAFASTVVEGKHVSGGGPSTFGQGSSGARPSAAEALYGRTQS